MRVVSLVPSLTETLLEWGVEVVACTRYCEQPWLAHVGGTKDPDVDAIVALRPDVVVVDREENRREDADSLAARGVVVHATHVVSLADVAPTLDELAALVGAAVPPSRPFGPRRDAWTSAFVPIWRRPWMTLGPGTYGASLLAHLGVRGVYDDASERYPVVDLADVALRSPQLVLLPSEPYAFSERHAVELRGALPFATVELVDGQDLLWWGARTPRALARLSASLEARSA